MATRAMMMALTLSLAACSPMYLAARLPVDVSDYRGDGTIVRLKHPINPGFSIEFAPFSLAAPHDAIYRLDGLPRPRHHSPYEVGLAVELSPDEDAQWPAVPAWLKSPSLGEVRIRVMTGSGQLVFDFVGPVAGQYWERRFGDSHVFAVIRVPNDPGHASSRFPSELANDDGKTVSALEVRYLPGSDSPSRQGQIRVRAGGKD